MAELRPLCEYVWCLYDFCAILLCYVFLAASRPYFVIFIDSGEY